MMMRVNTQLAATRHSNGTAIVEFVIVLPICLMLIIASAEFGRGFMQYNTLTQGVRDGARYLAGRALFGSTGTVVISGGLATETQNLVVYGNSFGAGSPILPGLTTADVTVADMGGGNVAVSATYPYNPIFAFVPRFSFGGNLNVTGITFQSAMAIRAL